ncbi:DNA repair helicase XPB [Effusibacillus dendaii]|uniref:DNA 3'-5' helicase n=1 Tax=Effusibacillus dendaii TaxID=2743772 RepID=A0A7I8D5Y4_9BACL|nr:DNA repair helicase XPB [Effusibacillus dendaii]BCJ85407.1 DEAD/DEAH box helicase [Effusibacillus dendaii]
MTVGKPLIVQSDLTLLLEVNNPFFETVRDMILRFAELVKSPEHFHTYRITRISLWNASTAGVSAEFILQTMRTYSRYPIPLNVQTFIVEETGKYGRVVLEKRNGQTVLTGDPELVKVIGQLPAIRKLVSNHDSESLLVKESMRGEVKRLLAKHGYPVKDLLGYVQGEYLHVKLKEHLTDDRRFSLRPYQMEAVNAFLSGGDEGGSGVVVLPCGAGKTVVGIAAMAAVKQHTLILVPNVVAVHQWRREILDKCEIPSDWVGEYTTDGKQIKPVLITTYQMLTYQKSNRFPHYERLNEGKWGLIVYDEVHLLPAPVFRLTADLQGTRRLGLTATLVREDGTETEVFSMIGPKKYDLPWKQLEQQGWIAETVCFEVAVPFDETTRTRYLSAAERQKYRIAAENPNKLATIRSLLRLHQKDRVLIIGQYLDQLMQVAADLNVPCISGQTPTKKREDLYEKFRSGELSTLVVSKVANLAVDLPDANVAIQISGSYGSRQEEAQRLGRLLRPNRDGGRSSFYTIVTRDSYEQERAMHRQLFLIEQGYEYQWINAEESFDFTGGAVR